MERLAYCESELIMIGAKLVSGMARKSRDVERWLEWAEEMVNEVNTVRYEVAALHAQIDNLMSKIWASVKTGEKLLEIGDGMYGGGGAHGGGGGARVVAAQVPGEVSGSPRGGGGATGVETAQVPGEVSVVEELAYCESELIMIGAKLSGIAGKNRDVERWLEWAEEMVNEVNTVRYEVAALHAHIDNFVPKIWASVKTGEKLLEIGDCMYGGGGGRGGGGGALVVAAQVPGEVSGSRRGGGGAAVGEAAQVPSEVSLVEAAQAPGEVFVVEAAQVPTKVSVSSHGGGGSGCGGGAGGGGWEIPAELKKKICEVAAMGCKWLSEELVRRYNIER